MCTRKCRSWRLSRLAAGPCRNIRNWAGAQAPSNNFNAIYFDAFVALACGVTDALFRFHDLHPGAPQRAGMQIDVAAAAVGHHKAEAFLVVEELDLTLDHRTGG